MQAWTHSRVSTRFVTGGTRGIGRAIAERLLRDGAAVAICGRTQASVDRAVAGMQPLAESSEWWPISARWKAPANFSSLSTANSTLSTSWSTTRSGPLQKVGDMTPAEWHLNIDLKPDGAFYCAHEALARFATRGADSSLTSPASPRATPSAAAPAITRQNLVLTVLRGIDAGSSPRQRARQFHHAGQRRYRIHRHSGKPRSADTSWMIAPEDVAEAVSMVLRMPARTMVSRVEIRPSRPGK